MKSKVFEILNDYIKLEILINRMKTQININIDKELLSDLDKYGVELNKTRAGLIEKAISAYFDKLDELVADKRIEGIISGKSELISLEEVFKKAGIDV